MVTQFNLAQRTIQRVSRRVFPEAQGLPLVKPSPPKRGITRYHFSFLKIFVLEFKEFIQLQYLLVFFLKVIPIPNLVSVSLLILKGSHPRVARIPGVIGQIFLGMKSDT